MHEPRLILSDLHLNIQSTFGYNSSPKKASADMKLEVNKSVNLEMKTVGVRHMEAH